MANLTRRKFLAASATLAAAAVRPNMLVASAPGYGTPAFHSKRILVGSGDETAGKVGIQAYHWDAATGTLAPDGIAAEIPHSTWLELSPHTQPGPRYLYAACELEEFQGKPTGAVASFSLIDGKLTAISSVSSTGKGTCHLTTDHTGRVVICANYTGGSAATFLSENGKLSEAVWTEQYHGYPTHGPVADRQEAAHAHFACVSPDNRFVYINDLGSDRIHIYKLNAATAELTPAGIYQADPGSGPRTLHFLIGGSPKAGHIAYSVNELASTIDILAWSRTDGSLHRIQQVELLPKGATGISRACDTVLSRDGRFAYFANRDHDFLVSFRIDPATGKLAELGAHPRTNCGGKIPRNFRLDPTERWMLVANQESSNITVFARDPKSGLLADQGKTFPAPTPMCIVFV